MLNIILFFIFFMVGRFIFKSLFPLPTITPGMALCPPHKWEYKKFSDSSERLVCGVCKQEPGYSGRTHSEE